MFPTRFSCVGQLRSEFMLFLPLASFTLGLHHKIPCPVTEARSSQDLENPRQFAMLRGSQSHLIYILFFDCWNPLAIQTEVTAICCVHTLEVWLMDGSFYRYPKAAQETEGLSDGSEDPHREQGCRQISTSNLGNLRMRNQS